MKKLGLHIHDQKHYKLLLLNCYWSVLGKKPA
jgi:demethylmenaquinone methyltransferase/2-methoxy-6-polyprenyl-1,4-benzoquinol methylase